MKEGRRLKEMRNQSVKKLFTITACTICLHSGLERGRVILKKAQSCCRSTAAGLQQCVQHPVARLKRLFRSSIFSSDCPRTAFSISIGGAHEWIFAECSCGLCERWNDRTQLPAQRMVLRTRNHKRVGGTVAASNLRATIHTAKQLGKPMKMLAILSTWF